MTPAHAPASVSPAHQSFAALRHPGYRPYVVASGLVMMADAIEHVISDWRMFQKFHSPALGGFAIISHWLPFLLFSVYSGALADRYDPRRIIQLGMLLFMAASFFWGLLFLTDTLEMWHAVVLLVIHGFAGVFWGPAAQILIHDIVGPAQLQSGVRLFATFRFLGLLMGPALGGAFLMVLGPAWGLFANTFIYLPLTLWLWKAPYGPRFREAGTTSRRAIRGYADILATIRAIAGNRGIVTMILLAGAASLFVGNGMQAQMPEFAEHLGHGDADMSYSILLGASAAGALSAGFVLESRSLLRANPRTALLLAILWCVAVAAFAGVAYYPLALALLFVAGFLDLAFESMAQALVQIHSPAELRGRVIGLYQMSANGLRAFSGITIGMGGSLIGIHLATFWSAVAVLAVVLALLAFSLRGPAPSD